MIGREILVVEDDRTIQNSMKEILEACGYTVSTASDGREALALMREGGRQPKLIILDMMLPVMNGWEFLNDIKADSVLNGIPVFVMTASPEARRSHRVDGFFRKPFDLSRFLRKVEEFVGPDRNYLH